MLLLGPPGTGKIHLATGLTIRACQVGPRVLFATADEGVTRLAEAHHTGRLQDELRRLGRYPLLVVDEVDYVPFGRWGEVFGDDIVPAGVIDRLVHHAEVISLKSDRPENPLVARGSTLGRR